MLVLKRRAEQRIRLTMTGELKPGETIEIMVLDAQNGWARVGIDADPERVQILRAELVKAEAEAA